MTNVLKTVKNVCVKERERDIEQNVYKWTSVLTLGKSNPFLTAKQMDTQTDSQNGLCFMP